MKKLMCAVAALTAGIALADVTSANIVGYQNKELRAGFKLVGAAFTNVGKDSIMLSDIKPVGFYANEQMLEDGYTDNDFQIYILKSNGGNEAVYGWYQENDGEVWDEESGEWSGELELKPGQGLWFNCNVYEDGYTLSNAGEALVEARNIPLRAGFSPIVIPLSCGCKLSDIRPIGYYNNAQMLEDCYTDNDFQVYILKSNGGNEAVYGWYQENDGEVWDEDSAEWSGDRTFQAGDALWVNCNVYENGYSLSFPGLDDLQD